MFLYLDSHFKCYAYNSSTTIGDPFRDYPKVYFTSHDKQTSFGENLNYAITKLIN